MNAAPTPAKQAQPMSFPLPQRHRRRIACAASIALGSLGVAATAETVRPDVATTAHAAR